MVKMLIGFAETMNALKETDEDSDFGFEEVSNYDGDDSDVLLTVDADK